MQLVSLTLPRLSNDSDNKFFLSQPVVINIYTKHNKRHLLQSYRVSKQEMSGV